MGIFVKTEIGIFFKVSQELVHSRLQKMIVKFKLK